MAFFSMIKILLLCTPSLSLLATLASGQNATNYLISGDHLSTSQYLIEGNTKLIIQNDCDLVLYNSTKRIWNSGTINKGLGCYLTLQENGKLVILDNKNDVVWDTKPIKPNGKYILIVQRDYKAVIYGPKFWATNLIGSDDVAVATALNGPMGVSGAKENMMMKMGKIIERNGNLVIYDILNRIVWMSEPIGKVGNYFLVLQRDRNVVIYGPGVWASGTHTYGSGNVVAVTALNGTMGVSGEEQNKVREMGKIMEVMRDE
ncbi:hypothetical protein M5K25_006357 [Dendrobium thyrsiflorum]|uniref:Bulb-type lectin domain-containing protein n=1 Tax=Dendrobium thyrsiflorum TaxID=117978 RepID=A0ABD0VI90_DENTH